MIEFPNSTLRRATWLIVCGALALTVWSRWAELTTTLDVPGSLYASAVTIDVQAAQGGQISEVYHNDFDYVRAGMPLAKLDTRILESQLAAVRSEMELAKSELNVLSAALDHRLEEISVPGETPVLASYRADFAEHLARLELLRQEQTASKDASRQSMSEIAILERQLDLNHGKVLAFSKLQGKGHFAQIELDEFKADALDIELQIERLQGTVEAFGQSSKQISKQIKLTRTERLNQLYERRKELEKDLSRYMSQEKEISVAIEQSVIRSSISGFLSDWSVKSETVVTSGQNLGQVTGGLGDLQVKMTVPSQFVDQVYEGQTGLVMFPTLPQRAIPKVRATVQSLARSSVLDNQTGQSFYSGVSTFENSDLSQLKTFLGTDFRLSLDLPVVVILEGRSTTVWDYLFGPVKSAFRRAIAD